MDYLEAFNILNYHKEYHGYTVDKHDEAMRLAMSALLTCAKSDPRCCSYCRYYSPKSFVCEFYKRSIFDIDKCPSRSQ